MSQDWAQFVEGYPSYVCEHKIKCTKYALKIWVKTPLTTPMRSRQESVHVLAELQLGMEDSKISKSQLDNEQSSQINNSSPFARKKNICVPNHIVFGCLWEIKAFPSSKDNAELEFLETIY